MIITTSASERGYGALLEQNFKNPDSNEDLIKPIEYFSKSYTPTQKKYPITEKELLAIVMSVEFYHSRFKPGKANFILADPV
jgi:hypothetical protein